MTQSEHTSPCTHHVQHALHIHGARSRMCVKTHAQVQTATIKAHLLHIAAPPLLHMQSPSSTPIWGSQPCKGIGSTPWQRVCLSPSQEALLQMPVTMQRQLQQGGLAKLANIVTTCRCPCLLRSVRADSRVFARPLCQGFAVHNMRSDCAWFMCRLPWFQGLGRPC